MARRGGTIDDIWFRRGVGTLHKIWDPDMHPRDDQGLFVSKGELEAAKTDPAVKAALEAKVTDPVQRHRLEAVIGDKPDAGSDAPASGADVVRFPRSTATVKYGNSNTPEARLAIQTSFKALIPKSDGSDSDIASIVGAPEGATVEVASMNNGARLFVVVRHPDIDRCERTISRDEHGNLKIHNDLFRLKKGPGHELRGWQVLGSQIDHARRLGVVYIDTHAAGNKGGSMNGYYTWPAIGYEAMLEQGNTRKATDAQRQVPGAKTIQDVFATKRGREWWMENGSDLYKAVFDLDPRSRSSIINAAYVAHKEAELAAKKQGQPLPREPERPTASLVALPDPTHNRVDRDAPPPTPRRATPPPVEPVTSVPPIRPDGRTASLRSPSNTPEMTAALNALDDHTVAGAAAYTAWSVLQREAAESRGDTTARDFWHERGLYHLDRIGQFPQQQQIDAIATTPFVGIIGRVRGATPPITPPTPPVAPPTPPVAPPVGPAATPAAQARRSRTRAVIHGHAAGHVVAWMANQGWTEHAVRRVLGHLQVEVSDASITASMRFGRTGVSRLSHIGGTPTPLPQLTPQHAEDLRALRQRG